MKFAEKWGDSIDIAVDLALQDLKLTRDQVTVTVLEQPSKGFLGIGSKLAKVRVEEKAPEKPARPETAEPERKTIKEESSGASGDAESAEKTERTKERPAREGRKEKRSDSRSRRGRGRNKERAPKVRTDAQDFVFEDLGLMSEKPDNLTEDSGNPAKAFLDELFKEMGLDVTARVYSGEDCVYAEIEGPDCGTVIGKRGQTLDSVQYLTSLVVNKGKSGYTRTIIDAEGYRKKRELTLEKLAVRLADKVMNTGRSVRLEPMNPYERKVIHSVLQKYDGVVTRSEGKEPYRRVIIEPEK